MAGLSLKHVYKTYNNEIKLKSGQESPKPAVSDFNMDIEDKEFIVFVGPSGCGKSTTLRMIAGLEEITSGEIYIDNRLVNNIEPKDRDIAMVFQSYALYPHMSVYDNMAFALRLRKIPDVKRDKKGNPILNKDNKEIPIMRRYTKDEIDEKVKNAAAILDITDYLKRKPKALSGGQRQRVALGRAIVRNPKVFLLDEPLSNLDAKLRSQMRTEITKLHEKLQTTFIYVTHDQVEAMTMGTRIVVMESGYVKQIDTPQNLYKYPENKFVAGFIGTPQMNFFDGVITKNGDKVTFKFDCDAEIILDYEKANKILTEYTDGKHRVTFGIRPDDIRLYDGSMDATEWEAEDVVVGVVENLGGETLIYADLDIRNKDNEKDGGSIVLKTNNEFKGRRGDIVKIAINKNNIHVFDKETEVSIKTRIPE